MNRQRRTGIVFITLALMAVFVTSASRGRTVAGAAVVHPEPQVGDCWNPPISDRALEQAMVTEGVAALDLGPCDGARLGEVVSVANTRVDTQQDCGRPAGRYVGLPSSILPTEVVSNGTTAWATTAWPLAVTVGPNALQVAAGQRWSACVVLGFQFSPDADWRPLPFAGSVRGLATPGGAAFDRFASCSNSVTSGPGVACDQPHRYEIFLQAYQVGSSETSSLETCREFVAELTGMSDPSADGRLTTVLLPVLYDQSTGQPERSTYRQATAPEGGSTVFCAVTPTAADEMLTSTLFGLREQAPPLR